MSIICYDPKHWCLGKQEEADWFQNTMLACKLNTANTKVLTFHRPDTSLFRIDLLLYHTHEDDRILVTGDLGDLVLHPTWNALSAANYRKMSYSYFDEKITCADTPLRVYDGDAVGLDTDQFVNELEEDNGEAYNKAAAQLARALAIHKSPDTSPDELDTFIQTSDDGYKAANLLNDDYEMVDEIINLGSRPSHQVQLVLEALRLCEQYDAFALTPDDPAIAL